MKKTMKEIRNSQAMKKFIHNKKAMLGLAIVTILVLAVVFIPLFADLDPYTTDRAAGFNKPPSDAHILGTDDVGRDLFARLLYGGRISLFVGITSTIISVLIGIPLGLIAGYFRGTAESIIMRTADAFMSFPSMVLILVLVAVFGPSILTVTVVIGVLGWTAIAKLIYGNVLSIREREYIQAARAVGVSTKKILFSEVLPNAIPPVWANISFRVAGAILTESSLSFLGMGVQTPQASWGNIIFAAQNLLVLIGGVHIKQEHAALFHKKARIGNGGIQIRDVVEGIKGRYRCPDGAVKIQLEQILPEQQQTAGKPQLLSLIPHHAEHLFRLVDADHIIARLGEHQGQFAGATAKVGKDAVMDAVSVQLFADMGIENVVVGLAVELIVKIRKLVVGHGVTLPLRYTRPRQRR